MGAGNGAESGISDGVIILRALAEEELPRAHALSEADDARAFIVPGTLDRFERDYASRGIRYLAIDDTQAVEREGRLAGYFILVLEDDDSSIECRRIVVGRKNRGIGKRAMALLDRYCREVLDRSRIWLDVYEFNTRGQRVYELSGYRFTGKEERDGKTLWFYEKVL